MITRSGDKVFPGQGIAPSLYSVGWGLARTSRFAGQTELWYPVLAHVYVVTELVDPEFKVHAILHDAAESVVGDQVATWKNKLTEKSEEEILSYIYSDLEIAMPNSLAEGEVKKADMAARAAEALLLGHFDPYYEHFQQIREDLPELYQEALILTRDAIAEFTPDICIGSTDILATQFEQDVVSYALSHKEATVNV